MKLCHLHKRRPCKTCGQCHACYPQLGPESHARPPSVIVALTLASGILAGGRAEAQAAIPDPNADPVRVTAAGGMLVTMGADSGTAVGPSALIDVDAPLAIGHSAWARQRYGLELTTAPGQTAPDLTQSQSFRAVSFRAAVARAVGNYQTGEHSWVRTLILAEASFTTRLPSDPPPLNRVMHSWGAGVALEDSEGNGVSAVVGRNQAADVEGPVTGPPPPGTTYHTSGVQLTIRGQVKVPGTNGVVQLRGDAVVNMILPDDPGQGRRDVVRIGAVADLSQLASVLHLGGK